MNQSVDMNDQILLFLVVFLKRNLASGNSLICVSLIFLASANCDGDPTFKRVSNALSTLVKYPLSIFKYFSAAGGTPPESSLGMKITV